MDCDVELLNYMDSVEFQADVETDEVYAQMTLQPMTPVILSSLFLHWVLIKMLGLSLNVSKIFHFYHCTCSKSIRIHLFTWNWGSPASSPPIIFVRP